MPEIAAAIAPLAPHNRANARAAAEVAVLRGHSAREIAAAMPGVVADLPDRRFQRISNPAGMDVYTDYAHHPTEMRCAVAMARERCSGTLRVVFQPHRYSRTKAFLNEFPQALELADEVVLCPVYAAFEKFVEGGDIADLYAAARAQSGGGRPRYLLARSCEEAWFHARSSMKPGDLTLLLGAGDIIGVVPLVESWSPPPERRIWIGAGANTWKSDLATGEEYVKTDGPAGASGSSLGIPWMAGIPGTVGGWIKMNAGAFGHSVSEALARVNVDGEWIDAKDCGFGYRHSGIKGEVRDFELKPEFAGLRGGHDRDGHDAAYYLARRRNFPPGTWGSVFKNPPGAYAGEVLERAGCKGLRVGGAYVWQEHANVIVRGDGATASDALALARIMCERAFCRCGVVLEPEICGLENALPDVKSPNP
jgi:UDP-N-acetylenolpyruvoylglucosamine reductase